MQNHKEKTAVSVFGVLITLGLIFLLCFLIPIATFRYTFLDINFIKKGIISEDDYEVIAEAMNKEFIDDITIEGHDIPTDDVFTTKFVKYYFNLFVDTLLSEDEPELDEEFIEDFVKQNLLPPKELEGLTDEEIQEAYANATDVMVESINKSINEVRDGGFAEAYTEFKKVTDACVIVIGAIVIVSILIMLIIYKKKHRAVRNTGIAITVAGALDTLIVGFFGVVFLSAFDSEMQKEINNTTDELEADIMEIISDGLMKLSMPMIFVCVIALVIGIILIIITCIIGSRLKKAYATSETDYYHINNNSNNSTSGSVYYGSTDYNTTSDNSNSSGITLNGEPVNKNDSSQNNDYYL